MCSYLVRLLKLSYRVNLVRCAPQSQFFVMKLHCHGFPHTVTLWKFNMRFGSHWKVRFDAKMLSLNSVLLGEHKHCADTGPTDTHFQCDMQKLHR